MTLLQISAASLIAIALPIPTRAQSTGETQETQGEVTTKWDVFIPDLVAIPVAPELEPAVALEFQRWVSSNVIERHVTESPPMDGLPPVVGKIKVTIEMVEPPTNYSPPPPPPPPAESPSPDESVPQLPNSEGKRPWSGIAFVSAAVHDSSRTFLRIYPNGGMDGEVTAWSNINFKLFSGIGGYDIRSADGEIERCSLLMGIGEVKTEAVQQMAARVGHEYSPPEIPPLPDIGVGGPAFQIVSGEPGCRAMDCLEQLHDLFRKEGTKITSQYEARQQAEEQRRAELIANPPKPADVTIRYWKGDPSANGQEVGK